jgi:mono/diheme cytochrome c family protein
MALSIKLTSSLHILAVGCALLAAPAYSQTPNPDSFQTVLLPVLNRDCAGCHTSGGHAGGFRMDTLQSFMQGGELGSPVVLGDPDHSLIMKAISYEDPNLKMPPTKGKIADADAAVIRKWIQQDWNMAPAISSTAAPTSAASATPKPAAPAPSVSPAAAAKPAMPAVAMASAAAMTHEQELFFESKVRPLLTTNCFMCHTTRASGGLRLDSYEAMMKGGKDGAVVVPGHPESSLLISAVHYSPKLQMPPTAQLKPEEIAALEQWVTDGALWPKTSPAPAMKITDAQKHFWSFQAPKAAPAPAVDTAWVKNAIDRFVVAKQQEKHLTVVADADKRTMIRRVTYDLTGLPPTPEEVQAFVNDTSPKAYEKLVDRLLASDAYGERWGRKWLDVVRYADTNGAGGDYPVAQLSKYRDYVIKAFNSDKPYDQFIKEQIAGDLLPSQSEPEHWEHIVATGYLAGTNRADGKAAYVSDAVDNVGSAFLGVTVGCARCHDHKFDPFPTADYYAMYGILNSATYPEGGESKIRFQKDLTYRDPKALEREDYKIFQEQLKPIQNAIVAVLALPGTYDDVNPQLQARRMHLYEHAPDLGESAYAIQEGKGADVKIQHYGDPKNLGDEVHRGTLQALGGGPLPADTKGSGRLELANWIASKDNPLTARVMVNRIWQGHFSKGLVATPNDFGSRGEAPSNQALLDYLSTTFMANGWSVKALQKEILMSHTYQLASSDLAANDTVDPDNTYLWRHSRTRMDAEEIRDSMLADSQLLDRTPGGEFKFPPQAQWNWEEQNTFEADPKTYESDHRTVYTMVQRSVRGTYFTLFDGPNTNVSTEQRSNSLTPLQALYFLNGTFPERCATNLANKLGTADEKASVQQAFLAVWNRPANGSELDQSRSFLRKASEYFTAHGATATEAQQKALVELIRAMFASNEFMFIE